MWKKYDKQRIKYCLLNIWAQLRGANLSLIYVKLIHVEPKFADYWYCWKDVQDGEVFQYRHRP